MSTNDAFIKAYRCDAARPVTPAPVRAPSVAEPAAQAIATPIWQPTVEIAAADYIQPTTTIAAAMGASETPPGPRILEPQPMPPKAASARIIGKRPLSSFQPKKHEAAPEQTPAPELRPIPAPLFTPETVLSAFQWPDTCRKLWESYSAEYERVAEKLLATSRAGRPIVGVTGINSGDGCSTTVLCLAVALAARKTRIALVDASFAHPNLAELLGTKPATSWADVLSRGLPVAEAMIRATRDRVDILPLQADRPLTGHEAADLVAGLQTSVTAGVLRTTYDLVLVDLGALLAPGAYAALSNLLQLMPIHAALVVSDPRTADAHDATVIGDLLDEDGCELLGVIENRAKPQAVA